MDFKVDSYQDKNKPIYPLSKRAKLNIDKYKSETSEYVFPVASGLKFNEYIKKVCEKAGFAEEMEKVRYSGSKQIIEVFARWMAISAHVARKTFVTLSL